MQRRLLPKLELAAAFGSFGSLRYRDQAERELRKLGHHVHRRTRPGRTDRAGIESLPERELQVARLTVDRKTNPQIAAELFLSQKTVETHLRNIFHKMAVTTRTALARRRTHRLNSEPATKIGPHDLLVLQFPVTESRMPETEGRGVPRR